MQTHDSKHPQSPQQRMTLTLRGVQPRAISVPTGTSANINERAWCVWGEGRRSPRMRHPSKEAAMTEATRLAGIHPGVVFSVFELTRVARRLK